MKTVGIIAEYNPFHNGHAYQFAKARQEAGADFLVIAMSGGFVQRGEPAVFDKYTRTAMALSAGADVVLEIPSVFACASAEDFAACGVALLSGIGVVDGLCFGCETADPSLLAEAAAVLAQEPEAFQAALRERLKSGMSYPAARAEALALALTPKAADAAEPPVLQTAAPG